VLESFSNGHFDASRLALVILRASADAASLDQRSVQYLNAKLIQPYGSTETGGLVTFFRYEDHLSRIEGGNQGLLESCGRPSQHADVRVLREDASVADRGEVRGKSAFGRCQTRRLS